MTVTEMVRVTNATVLLGGDQLDLELNSAFCSDLMSDVLAFVNEDTVLITGLMNPHVIRTSEMLDLKCLVFARGKVPTDDILEGADELGMVVLHTKMTAFTACGLLYEAGLRGVPVPAEWHQGGSVS
jgi:predicted transcriptional regulator